MINGSKYYDFDPAKAVVYLLLDMFGKTQLKIVSYFKLPNASFPRIYSFKNGVAKIVDKKSSPRYPDRSLIKEKIKIQKINLLPVVKAELNPQRTLLENENSESVITFRFYNPTDDKWDYIFILIDQKMVHATEQKIAASGLKTETKSNVLSIVKSYYSVIYPILEELVKNEYRKFDYTRELIDTLEKTIQLKTNLQKKNDELRNNRKSDLLAKVNSALELKALELNKEVKLSEKALDYVFNYVGDEEKLINAISNSVNVCNILLSAKGIDYITVDQGFIQIQLEYESNSSPDLNRKRMEKAEYFLNKYEDASQTAENFGKKVTITAIAFHSKPSVKPPAISSNISNYKTEIRSLLATKRNKWIVLRTKFKPIRTLVSSLNQ